MSVTSRALGVTAALALGVLAGCGGSDESADPPATYPRDDELRINQLQLVGTHNSYHLAPTELNVVELQYSHAPLDEQLDEQGVRKFELDVQYDPDSGEFEVFHILLVDEGTTCRRFTDCLKLIKTWSDAHPGHHPLFIQMEPKGGWPSTAEKLEPVLDSLDDELTSVWPRDRLITPDDVRGDHDTLRAAIVADGWPTLGQSRGKLVLFINNSRSFRDVYTRDGTSLKGRTMFVEAEPGDPYEAFRILNDPKTAGDDIEQAVRDGFIVRTRADSPGEEALQGDTSKRDAAFASGAQIISTDYPAPVDGIDYIVELPGGTPSRCNPISAPKDCEASDIESPDALAP